MSDLGISKATLVQETGCSLLFAEMALIDKPNAVRANTAMWLDSSCNRTQACYDTDGDFVTACFEGDVTEAYKRADIKNLSDLKEVTGMRKDEVISGTWE